MKREPVVERNAAVRSCYQHQGERNNVKISPPDDREDLIVVDMFKRMRQCKNSSDSNRDADDGTAQAFQPGTTAKLLLQQIDFQGAHPSGQA